MTYVFFTCNPFEVFGSVVGLVTVYMVNLRLVFWILNERLSN